MIASSFLLSFHFHITFLSSYLTLPSFDLSGPLTSPFTLPLLFCLKARFRVVLMVALLTIQQCRGRRWRRSPRSPSTGNLQRGDRKSVV